MQEERGKKTKQNFKSQLAASGYSDNFAEVLWTWYDPTNKKGVASF